MRTAVFVIFVVLCLGGNPVLAGEEAGGDRPFNSGTGRETDAKEKDRIITDDLGEISKSTQKDSSELIDRLLKSACRAEKGKGAYVDYISGECYGVWGKHGN